MIATVTVREYLREGDSEMPRVGGNSVGLSCEPAERRDTDKFVAVCTVYSQYTGGDIKDGLFAMGSWYTILRHGCVGVEYYYKVSELCERRLFSKPVPVC